MGHSQTDGAAEGAATHNAGAGLSSVSLLTGAANLIRPASKSNSSSSSSQPARSSSGGISDDLEKGHTSNSLPSVAVEQPEHQETGGHKKERSFKTNGGGNEKANDGAPYDNDDNKSNNFSDLDSKSVTSRMGGHCMYSTVIVVLLILVLGMATSAAFMGLGMTTAYTVEAENFERSAVDLVNKIQNAWEDYVNAASMIHNRCRKRNFTRQDFRELYEYLIGSGLEFQAAQFDPNITREERPLAEEEARQFYEKNYPSVKYRGIVGFEYSNSTTLEPRSEQDFYFPIHYMEPVVGNEPGT